MKFDYHIVVVGAGSAGLVVASGAAGLGAKVALIEGHKMGGDCLNYGCVPSKAFLHAVRSGDYQDIASVMDRVRAVIQEIEPHDSVERYEGLGVDIIQGMGQFEDPHTIRVGDRLITGKSIVIATGSRAYIPLIPGLKDVPYLTNQTVFDLKKKPAHLIVLGAGPIGLELGQGFRWFGSAVTIIDMSPSLFVKDDPEVGPLMKRVMIDEGVDLFLSSQILSVDKEDGMIVVTISQQGKIVKVSGDSLLVSLGRRPVTDTLGLERVGVHVSKEGYVKTKPTLQSSLSHVYACGDVAGPYQFTHMAGYQAGVVIRNCLFPFKVKVDYSAVPWTTYTQPEVSHVGYTEPQAKKAGVFKDKVMIEIAQMDRAKVEDDRDGFLKLILGKRGRLIGATLVGKKAGEMMPVATLAIQKKLKGTAFMSLIFSYPTSAEIFKFASLDLMKRQFKPWMKRFFAILFRLRSF